MFTCVCVCLCVYVCVCSICQVALLMRLGLGTTQAQATQLYNLWKAQCPSQGQPDSLLEMLLWLRCFIGSITGPTCDKLGPYLAKPPMDSVTIQGTLPTVLRCEINFIKVLWETVECCITAINTTVWIYACVCACMPVWVHVHTSIHTHACVCMPVKSRSQP